MTAKEDLMKKLRARGPKFVDRESLKMTWAAEYAALLDLLVSWMRELPPDLVRVSFGEKRQLLYDDLGTYSHAPRLDIDLCGALVVVQPLARVSPGGIGLVAVSRTSKTRRLSLSADKVWFVEPPLYGYKTHTWPLHPLTQDSFYGVLSDLLR